MEPMLPEFERFVSGLDRRAPRLQLISNVTGGLVSRDEIAGPDYWRRHARETVQFARGIETLRLRGFDTFLEIGPAPALLEVARKCVPDDFGSLVLLRSSLTSSSPRGFRQGSDCYSLLRARMGSIFDARRAGT